MLLTRVKIRHFRNLGIQELEIPAEGVAIIGANAQGKSNLLEALYYLETFRSFRGASDDQLVAFGEDVFWISALLCPPGGDGDSREVTAGFRRKGRRKKITLNGAEPDRIGDALGELAAVIFSPSDVGIISEGPDRRRRFLDIVLSLNEPGYLTSLQQFRHALAQRNASLKGDQPWAAVRVWDDRLVKEGARLMDSRRRWILAQRDAFSAYYSTVAGGRTARLGYRPHICFEEGADLGSLEACYRETLVTGAETERRMRTTMSGPQRDDMMIVLEGDGRDIDVRTYGSGGQRRTAALALRLVEAATVREARGREPLILLDDLFAELDEGRSERIMELMEREETGQVILTAPKESDVKLRRDALPRWRIEAGRILA